MIARLMVNVNRRRHMAQAVPSDAIDLGRPFLDHAADNGLYIRRAVPGNHPNLHGSDALQQLRPADDFVDLVCVGGIGLRCCA